MVLIFFMNTIAKPHANSLTVFEVYILYFHIAQFIIELGTHTTHSHIRVSDRITDEILRQIGAENEN